ncbi:MAG: hypothetical protein GY856_40145 [bacterium]|nr:hypothetical protein [bacterium]
MARDPSYVLRDDDSFVEVTNVSETNRFLIRPCEELIQARYLARPDPRGKLTELLVRPKSVGREPGSNDRAW